MATIVIGDKKRELIFADTLKKKSDEIFHTHLKHREGVEERKQERAGDEFIDTE